MGRGSGKAGAALAGVLAGVGATAGLIWISYLLARGRTVFGEERAAFEDPDFDPADCPGEAWPVGRGG